MSRCTLCAYALPGDRALDRPAVVRSVNEFISSRVWLCPDVWAVDQSNEPEEGELGLNLALPDPGSEPLGWFSDIDAVVDFCIRARTAFERDFVIGIADESGSCEDIIEIDSEEPDIACLAQFLGDGPSGVA